MWMKKRKEFFSSFLSFIVSASGTSFQNLKHFTCNSLEQFPPETLQMFDRSHFWYLRKVWSFVLECSHQRVSLLLCTMDRYLYNNIGSNKPKMIFANLWQLDAGTTNRLSFQLLHFHFSIITRSSLKSLRFNAFKTVKDFSNFWFCHLERSKVTTTLYSIHPIFPSTDVGNFAGSKHLKV